jgi:predicted transcriptional regulator
MDIQTLTNELYEINKRIDKASREIFKLAKDKAEAEREYQKALALEIIKLKGEGTPATLIMALAKGTTADLEYSRDLADGTFKSAFASLDAIKTQASVLQTITKYQDNI